MRASQITVSNELSDSKVLMYTLWVKCKKVYFPSFGIIAISIEAI